MSKRRVEEEIAKYRAKIRRLKDKTPRWRRIIVSDSSSEDSDEISDVDVEEVERSNHDCSPPPEPEPGPATGTAIPRVTDPSPAPELAAVVAAAANAASTTDGDAPDLDPEFLEALGTKTDDEPEYGDNVHENLSRLWEPVLKKGIGKEDREKIIKEYLVPANCKLLQAPKLNLEISAAVPESSRTRDKKIATFQQQLGVGITAVNRAMEALINKEENGPIKAVKHLSAGCRILCDLHHGQTQSRIKLISPNLDKNFLNIIQDSRRDSTLFGEKLGEKIKSSRVIEKQGLQIKKSAPSSSTGGSSARTAPPPPRGNWSAPPRHHGQYKGARGPNKKQPPRKAPPPPPPAPTASRATSRPLTRAQAQQPPQ